MSRIYLDHNATTPPSAASVDRMSAVLREEFGNPSSVHHFGQRAKAALDEARSQVAALLGADPSEIVFTGSGTEGDNIAIRGVAEALEGAGRKHIIASSIEHEAVLNTVKALARRGWRTTLLPVDASGIVSPDELNKALADDTALVSIMHANNEIGTIQPITELQNWRARDARSSTQTRCRQRAKSRSTSRRLVWICSRSRLTSSMDRKAWARCGSGGASA